MDVRKFLKLLNLALLSGALVLHAPAYADEVLVDFEDQPIQEYPSGSELIIETPGLTVTISRPGAKFGIVTSSEDTFGQKALAPIPAIGSNFIAAFSNPATSVSFSIGNSFSEGVSVTAYDAEGTELATQKSVCCNDVGLITMTVSASGMKSIEFTANPFSLFGSVSYDNFTIAFEKEIIDLDKDGIADDVDACKGSDMRLSVIIDGCDTGVSNVTWYNTGCTTSDYVTACAKNAINHGRFGQCVKDFTQSLQDNGFLNDETKGNLQSCAAQAKLP